MTDALASNGFGVLTIIDVRATLRKKLDVEFRPYTILGACNPQFAHRALLSEDKIGATWPFNVVVQELAPNRVEVSAADPVAAMMAIHNPALVGVAGEVRALLKSVIDGA